MLRRQEKTDFFMLIVNKNTFNWRGIRWAPRPKDAQIMHKADWKQKSRLIIASNGENGGPFHHVPRR